jgi:hypothetical protein
MEAAKRLSDDLIRHMDDEEMHLTTLVSRACQCALSRGQFAHARRARAQGRLHVNLQESIDVVRRVWAITSLDSWRIIMPFLVRSQFIHARRVRALQCFLWALPEKAHVIGRIVHEGVDEVGPLGPWHVRAHPAAALLAARREPGTASSPTAPK